MSTKNKCFTVLECPINVKSLFADNLRAKPNLLYRKIILFFKTFVWPDCLGHSQQFCSHVRTGLPGLNQY